MNFRSTSAQTSGEKFLLAQKNRLKISGRVPVSHLTVQAVQCEEFPVIFSILDKHIDPGFLRNTLEETCSLCF